MTAKKKRGKKAAPRAPKKKDERTVAEKMRDHLREQFKDPEAAHTFEGIGLSSVREVMPTRLDVIDRHVVGIGGLPYARIVEVSGQEDTGKSSLVNHLMWAAQQDGAVASLGDAERKVQPNWVDVFKVDRPNVLLLPANTIEEYLESVILTIKKFGKRNKIAFFLDSVATAIPQKALDEDLTEGEIPGAAAAAWSRGLRDLNHVLSDSLALVVLVNQQRCVSADELVITERGIIPASYATGDKLIVGLAGKLTTAANSAWSRQTAIRILTKDGRWITCGKNHPVLSVGAGGELEWIKASKVRGGTWVAIPRQVELPDTPDAVLPVLPPGDSREEFTPVPLTANEDFCRFLGMWFSDGALLNGRDQCVIFGEKSRDRRRALVAAAAALGWQPSKFGKVGFRFGARVYRLLASIGCQVGARDKNIPFVVTGRRQWRSFLRGMFDSHPTARGFFLTFANKHAARKVQIALLGFGVYARSKSNRRAGGVAGRTGAYLYVSGVDAERYVKEIGFEEKEKEKRVLDAVGVPDHSSRGKPDIAPRTRDRLVAVLATDAGLVDGRLRRRVRVSVRSGANVAMRDYVAMSRSFGFPDVLSAFRWVQVKQTYRLKRRIQMVDFDVPNGAAFVAGGIMTHNSIIGSMYGPNEQSSGGRAIKHYSSLRLAIGHGKSLKDGEMHVGKWCSVRAIKNHLGPNYKSAKVLLHFERGFDDARSTLLHAKEVGAVDAKAQSVKEARKNLGWLAEADEEAPDELVADVEVKEGR